MGPAIIFGVKNGDFITEILLVKFKIQDPILSFDN